MELPRLHFDLAVTVLDLQHQIPFSCLSISDLYSLIDNFSTINRQSADHQRNDQAIQPLIIAEPGFRNFPCSVSR
jgi:hypothetical protein